MNEVGAMDGVAGTASGPGGPGSAPALPVAAGSVVDMAKAARWWVEESLRKYEGMETLRGDEILYALVQPDIGLLYVLERRLGGV